MPIIKQGKKMIGKSDIVNYSIIEQIVIKLYFIKPLNII